ncbi:TonB-dependent receptor [Algoriphagus sp. AGSA1]|uniref:SusC/RagA family TonB-linked outer membrane protein n=1 Tax=Algoriphagus sp. AGSA1 TaxID=2907213 RepID=UPI001F344609|nr:TonB-dependent receptor [Algoriphagus sp. AGSA1]MCE7054817.1 TonB-dependent receptor [Algoriphagus sp. AGSA1]
MINKPILLILRMTKYTLYVFLFQMLVLNVALAHTTKAQKIDEVFVNVSFSEEKLLKVLRAVEKQTEFRFTIQENEEYLSKKISVSDPKISVENLLKVIGRQTGLNFQQVNRNISMWLASSRSGAQHEEIKPVQIDIAGKVTDSFGDPLPGVTIILEGSASGTVTDIDGVYTISAEPGDVLVFSFIGFIQQKITVANQTEINVTMREDEQALEEVVVVGYGTQKKSDVTGSVVKANIDAFRESPNVNIAQSLQGTVPGLTIGQVNRAGQNPSISIRGRTTLNGNQDVLIVVDGIIFTGGLNDLNPTDIESIDVLKDASSMAIYGAQAANGVILITTKSGKTEQKPIFNYTGTVTTQTPANRPELLDREGYLNKVRDQDWELSFLAPDYTQPNPDYDVGARFEPVMRDGYLDGTEFDWWDESTQTGYITNHNLSVTGATAETSYFMSTSYTKQEGFIMNDQYERITARINLDHQILDWFRFGVQSFGSFADNSGEIPLLGNITTLPPTVVPWDEEGEIIMNPDGAQRTNPFIAPLSNDFDKNNNLFANVYADIAIPFVNGLNYRVNFGNNASWRRHYRSNEYGSGGAGEAFKRNYNSYDWTLDHILTYRKRFSNNHGIDVTAVVGRRELAHEGTEANGSNYNNLNLGYHDLSLGQLQLIQSNAWHESYLYQTARINYDFGGKYLLTATVRRDGFSGFSANNKYGVFPSVGLGWVISEESFMDLSWMNYLKFRGSYGTNGNLTSRYSSLARVNLYPAYVFGNGGSTVFGQSVSTLSNPDLSWETTTGYNFGLDFSLFDNRMTGTLDYYQNTTNDLLFSINIPEISGFNSIATNVGEIANRGMELILKGDVVKRNQFNWNASFNISFNRNRIVSLLGLDADGDGVEDDLVASGLFIGESINTIFDYESGGIIQLGEEAPPGFFVGTHRIVDNNNDGIVDANDRVVIGREEPAFSFGILNELKYKNFTLRVFINSIQGGKDGYMGLNNPGFGVADNARRNNYFKDYDYWTPSNPDARYRAQDKAPGIEYRYYGDRSFVRIQDVTLAYRLNQSTIEKWGLQGLKVFASGKNLATFTDWVGWDPETGSGLQINGVPVMKGVSFGVDVRF